MFMQPIEHPVIERSRRRNVTLKLIVGGLSIAAMVPVMALWWIGTAVWLPVAGAARVTRFAARASYDFALFAGESVIGR